MLLDRTSVLRDLLTLRRPISQIIQELHHFPWDSETELAEFSVQNAISVLDRFTNGTISDEQLEAWANAIESREDIFFNDGASGFLNDLIFKLANQELSDESLASIVHNWRSEQLLL